MKRDLNKYAEFKWRFRLGIVLVALMWYLGNSLANLIIPEDSDTLKDLKQMHKDLCPNPSMADMLSPEILKLKERIKAATTEKERRYYEDMLAQLQATVDTLHRVPADCLMEDTLPPGHDTLPPGHAS